VIISLIALPNAYGPFFERFLKNRSPEGHGEKTSELGPNVTEDGEQNHKVM